MTVLAGSEEMLDKTPAVLSAPVLGEIGGLQEPRPGFGHAEWLGDAFN